ncbi:MAG: restriction endonuclease subunit S [Rubrivivax sp.]|nr:restriction endonuclease subunit S [Rubrivivax sp.]
MSDSAIGRLPAHWRLKRLRFVTSGIEQGWSPQCDNEPADEDSWGVMKVGCVNGHRFDATENKALPADLDPLPEYELHPGDVLVSRANTRELVGSAAVVPEGVRGKLLLCDKLFRIRPEPNLDPRFLTYLLRTPAARCQYERDATGASGSMQNIGQDTIKDLSVPMPGVEDQARIALFLNWKAAQIDGLLAKKQALIERLNERRVAVIARTVAQGLGTSVPKRAANVSWLHGVPHHWQIQRVKFIARIGNGSTPNRDDGAYWNDGSYAWLNSSVVNQEVVTEADQFVTSLALAECHLPIIDPPAVLVGITGQGRTRGMATTLAFQATINQHIAYVKPDETQVDARYLRRVFDAAYAYLRSESDGGGSTKGAITCEQIAEMAVPVPPLPEQVEIALHIERAVARIDVMVAKTQAAIDRLTEYRTALITAAVTGQIDVRDVAVPTPA